MAETVAQRLQRAADLPACQAKVVFTFPDGWTVRRLERVSDLLREGSLMGNCLEWSDYRHQHRKDDARLRARGHTNWRYFSLRDRNNLPHLTFEMHNWSGRVRGHSRTMSKVLGRHNSDPKPKHLDRLYAWARTLPGRWYHTDGPRRTVPLTAECREPIGVPRQPRKLTLLGRPRLLDQAA